MHLDFTVCHSFDKSTTRKGYYTVVLFVIDTILIMAEVQAGAPGIRIAIDRGGTFTDAWAWLPETNQELVFKLLSQCPDEYQDAPTECIRQILETATQKSIPRGTLLDLSKVEFIRMGTTVATNALLERKGERTALIITKGFQDILEIGNQARPHIFDLSVRRMAKLYETVLEVDERVTVEGFAEDPEPQPIDIDSDPDLTLGLAGEAIRIIKVPDYEQVRHDLTELWDRGYRSVAVAMMHSYTYPTHELGVARVARELGFKVAVSSELQKMAKIVPRSQSAVADAYLSPITDEYLTNFRKGFKGELKDEHASKLLFNQSDGGLTSFENFTGVRGVLSGPAGGVIGLSKTCYSEQDPKPVLGFDSEYFLQRIPASSTNQNQWEAQALMSLVTLDPLNTSSKAPSQKSQSKHPSSTSTPSQPEAAPS